VIELGATLLAGLAGTLRDVLPVIALVVAFQTLVLRSPLPDWRGVVFGSAYVVLGLTLFLVGLEQALFPLGRAMAEQLTAPALLLGEGGAGEPHWGAYYWVFVFGAALGFATTIAEPALISVAIKAHAVSGGAIRVWSLRVAVALGVAAGVAVGSVRIVTGTPLHYYIIAGYVVVVLQTALAPREIIALAYDSGGVTTSTVTVPLVAALGLGLASAVPGRNPLIDGFGLIAFASLFPMVTVMGYAQFARWRNRRPPTAGGGRPDTEPRGE